MARLVVSNSRRQGFQLGRRSWTPRSWRSLAAGYPPWVVVAGAIALALRRRCKALWAVSSRFEKWPEQKRGRTAVFTSDGSELRNVCTPESVGPAMLPSLSLRSVDEAGRMFDARQRLVDL